MSRYIVSFHLHGRGDAAVVAAVSTCAPLTASSAEARRRALGACDGGCCSGGTAECVAGAGAALRSAAASLTRLCGFGRSGDGDAAIGRRLGVLLVKRSLARAASHQPAVSSSGSGAAGDRTLGESGNTSLNASFASESGQSAHDSRLDSQRGTLASFEPCFSDEGFGAFGDLTLSHGSRDGGAPCLGSGTDKMRLNWQRLLELERHISSTLCTRSATTASSSVRDHQMTPPGCAQTR